MFLWFMIAIHLPVYLQLIRIGQVFNDAESNCKQFFGSYSHLLSDTHRDYPFFATLVLLWHTRKYLVYAISYGRRALVTESY